MRTRGSPILIPRRTLLLAAAAILLPRSVRAQRRYPLAGGRPRVDWRNPLSYGLTGCYFPGNSGTTIYNLAQLGADLAVQAGAVYGPRVEGLALISTASNSLAFAAATAAQKPTAAASCFWRGILTGTPAANCTVFGVTFTNADTTPFDAYNLTYTNAGTLIASGNIAGANVTSGWAAPTNVVISAGMTLRGGGNIITYGNGLSQGSTAAGAGSITYGTPQMCMGGYEPVTTRTANCNSFVGYTWNRELTATEMAALHFEPYQLLTWEPVPK